MTEPLSKIEADALRYCHRILARHYSPCERDSMIGNIESHIQKGKWPKAFHAPDLARLFYPNDDAKAATFLNKMNRAIKAGELRPLPGGVFLPGVLTDWQDCDPVPKDSPLRHWLPPFMHGDGETDFDKTAPPPVHVLPGIPSKEIIEGFRLPQKNPDWDDKLRHLAAAANHYTALFDDGLSALVERGGKGKGSHTWNPARFGVRLIEAKERNYSAIHACIKNHWANWLDEFDRLIEKRGIFDPY
jgi:hypothetical protein